MRGASLASLTTARTALDRELSGTPSAAAWARSDELFALVDALDATPAALRALANPNRPATAKRTFVSTMMAGHSPDATTFVADLVTARWSHDRDLADGLEQLGIEAALVAIGSEGQLEAFENQLFAVERFLARERDVRIALSDTDAAASARVGLARRLWAGTLDPIAQMLVERVVRSPRGRSLQASLLLLEAASASRRGRMVATVSAAAPLTTAQTDRLAGLLASAYGHPIRLDVSYDPTVVGGLRIGVGSDLVDATVLARLVSLKRAIAS
ncbi:MAG: F0F1 ATP synthase subunit delta [Bifidobacteriaceae bacterium]|jgi:F-type H+-transporting ATPase subunit delta|nr:F0F1 ATP synthase subunit delta [Bifidobacteriaceae bacterium]